MHVVRSGDGDKLNRRIGQQLFARSVGVDFAALRQFVAFGVDVVHADQFDAFHALHFFGMESAHPAVADHGSADHFSAHNLLSFLFMNTSLREEKNNIYLV
ncbi:hypothetical protein SDC9_144482 [bioreactor metagenome]|uniref:Uncharacterized protein n=1 Tax=bioreactor metagenome TaxID=1076179 RepID=A0A645E6Z9_9ZZZZ